MVDINRETGAVIGNFDSALQSVWFVLTTRIGEVCLKRELGAGVVELLGRLMTPSLFVAWQTLLAAAIDLWEPRFRVRQVHVDGSADALRIGNAAVSIEVDWRPHGHLGDETVEGVRVFSIRFGRSASMTAQ